MAYFTRNQVNEFVSESNAIEGITRDPTPQEIDATVSFLSSPLTFESAAALQAVYAPGKPIRDRAGMNVRVGSYIAPDGGRDIYVKLRRIIDRVNSSSHNRFATAFYDRHVEFETLHPFMDGNGRTGRALWAWHMLSRGQDPFALPFLHRWYYQSLEASEAIQ